MMSPIAMRVLLSDLRLQGWTASLLVHTAVVSAAVFTVPDLAVLPEKEPFRWDVSFVKTPAADSGEPAHAVSPDSHREPSASRSVSPVKPPVTEAIEQVQPPAQAEISPVVTPLPPPIEQQTAVHEPEQAENEARAVETEPVVPPASKSVEQQTVVQQPEPPAILPEPIVAKAPTVESPPVSQPITEPPPQAAQAPAESEAPPAAATPPATLVAKVDQPAAGLDGPRADYGWLAHSLWQRVMELKRYPHRARLNHWEGKVVLRAVIRDDGHLEELALQESSGYEELDEAAMDLIREACPLQLARPLGRAQVVVQVPITYALR